MVASGKLGKFLVIVGPTASGKSELAFNLAKHLDGELICADSATIRRDMDIGTAKPSSAERRAVPHYLLDIVAPDERFTAADFKRLAEQAILEITEKGKLPIIVGGTGLYVDALIYDYQFGGKGRLDDRKAMREGARVIGLKVDRSELIKNINRRVDDMLGAGLEHEVLGIAEQYGWDAIGLKNVGYAQWQMYYNHQNDLEKPRSLIIRATKDLAKRQSTWFKRNNSIHWIDTPVNLAAVVDLTTTLLNN